MNKGLIIGLSAVAVIGGIVAYKYLVPPSFELNENSVIGCGAGCRKIDGSFNFGRKKNVKFNNSTLSATAISGRDFMNFGWNLIVAKGKDGVIFELQKNGKKVKTLKELK